MIAVTCLGIKGPLYESESRTTLFTNVMVIWGTLSLLPMAMFLNENNVSAKIYVPSFSVLVLLSLFILYLNSQYKYIAARFFALLTLNFAGWQAVILFGKSFNGYYLFFVALIYSVMALTRAQTFLRSLGFVITFLALPVVDYMSYHQVIPVTELHSSDFSVSILVIDSLIVVGFISILMCVEKYFSDSYEDGLKSTNNKLENLVQRRTNLLLQSKEKNIQTDVMKAQFLANISHELRTPVQGIIGFNELANDDIKKMIEESHPDKRKTIERELVKNLASISQSSRRLLDLLEKLFDLTKKGRDAFKANPHLFSVQEMILESVKKNQPHMSENKIELKIKELENFNCYSDSVLIEQSLSCLLVNAIKYSKPNTTISVLGSIRDDRLEISVINKGVGVLESESEAIFEAFFQGSLTDNRTGGTGLGLALCKKYMEAIQGKVLLVNNDFRATQFKLSFPFYLKVDKEVGELSYENQEGVFVSF